MQHQNFSNHIRKHPLYHYVLVPVSLVLIPVALINVYFHLDFTSILLLIVSILLHLTVFVTRFYAKKNQNRIIRLELRLRYYLLTGKSFELLEDKLSFSQLAALRFAPDHELLDLLADAETLNLQGVQIKRNIKQWKPDLMRV